jgi:hypothetical protein
MIQIDPMELDAFILQDVDDSIGLQAFISIEELVQLATIVRGVNVATIDVVANVLPNEGGKMMEQMLINMQQPLIVIVNLQLCKVVTNHVLFK